MTSQGDLAEIFHALNDASYSVYQVHDRPDYMELPGAHERRSGRILPKRMDGFAIGNSRAFATISVRCYAERIWTTSISQLYGPTYATRIVRESYAYGGNYTSPFPFHDFVLEIDGVTFRPDQTQSRLSRRVLGAAIVNASMNIRGVQLDTINFCPSDPKLPAVVRAIRVRNLGPIGRQVRVLSYFGFDETMVDLPNVEATANGFTAIFDRGVLGVSVGQQGPAEVRACAGDRSLWGEVLRRSESRKEAGHTSKFDSMLKYSSYDSYVQSVDDESVTLRAGERLGGLRDLGVLSDCGHLGPGQETHFSLYLSTGLRPSDIEACEDALTGRGPRDLFCATLSAWQDWSSKPFISTSSRRVEHLIDSVKVLIKTHQLDEDGFATAMNFFGFRSWIRDNYYLGRTLLKMGKPEEALANLSFFYHKWKVNGVCEHYPFIEGGRIDIWNLRTEGPSLLALMLRDYYEYTGDTAKLLEFADMATEPVKQLAFSSRGLQPLCGSETYRFATVTDPWAESADNTFSSVCALEFAAEVLSMRVPRSETARQFLERARLSRRAVKAHLMYDRRIAHFLSEDGYLDEKLVTNILARPFIVGFCTRSDATFRKGITDAWDCNYRNGLVRCDPNFYLVPGNTAGYMLYCLAELDAAGARTCLDAVLELASCSGTFFEFYDVYDVRITNERLRMWDSASILEGVLHYLFGIGPVRDDAHGLGVGVAPHVNDITPELRLDSFPVHGDLYSVRCSEHALIIAKNGREVLKADRPLRVQLFDRYVRVEPVGAFASELDAQPLTLETGESGVTSKGGGTFGTLDLRVRLGGKWLRYNCKSGERAVTARGEGSDAERQEDPVFRTDTEVNMELVAVNQDFQKIGFVEPGKEYRLCGRAWHDSEAPYQGSVASSGDSGEAVYQTDSYGCFQIPFGIKADEKRSRLRCSVTAGGRSCSYSLPVGPDPFTHLGAMLTRSDGAVAIVCSSDNSPAERAVLYEIWKQVLLANGVNLPVAENPNDNRTFIAASVSAAGSKQLFGGTRISRKRNLSVYRRGRGGSYVFVVETQPEESVMSTASALMDVLKNRTSTLRRHYRQWRDHSFIPLYEYNATMRDIRVLQEVGTFPEAAAVDVEVEPTVECWIAGEKSTSGLLAFGAPESVGLPPDSNSYVRVYEGEGEFIRTLTAFHCTRVIRKLVIEADAGEHAPFAARVKITLPQTSFFLEQPFPLYFDGGRDQMRFYRQRDGANTLEVAINPGVKLEETKSRAKRTFRQIEIAVGGLKPEWLP